MPALKVTKQDKYKLVKWKCLLTGNRNAQTIMDDLTISFVTYVVHLNSVFYLRINADICDTLSKLFFNFKDFNMDLQNIQQIPFALSRCLNS